ncbi:hypothetical protein GCN78_03640 [Janthinobacterium rivuli]|uniref:DNA-directed RNA polymerase subunit alpha C-terminal domain-containing protein n=1 Tax=Janthinobacterium sp. FT68W TaxID=2654255 RepID=UPI0012643DBD|nr:DNA-directed RNA polymerase subunit alpha C-terminal domain-containing protein [Janthinobacterium sp. FT68W]KAB8054772.1 hypothetical protein GCN78_03640 [Janthinobacterium sp. FT68W]
MSQLRAFLLVRLDERKWNISVHRELGSVFAAWNELAALSQGAVVHVGFWRPDTAAFEKLLDQWKGRVLISESARFALPSPCIVAPCPAGEIEGIPFYVSLTGWGYETTADELGLSIIPQARLVGATPPLGRRDLFIDEHWYDELSRQNPEQANAAAKFGVVNEETYLSLEHGLTPELRQTMGWNRYVYYSGCEPDEEQFVDQLRYAPPWLLSLPISVLSLSVRPQNCMRENSIATIEDLANIGAEAILKFPKMGRKSLKEINEKLILTFREGPSSPLVRIYLNSGRSSFTGTHFAKLLQTSKEQEDTNENQAAAEIIDNNSGNFADALALGFSLLRDSECKIMRLRMGIGSRSRTLQEIGEEFGVSRERIRQRESKCIARINRHLVWSRDIEPRLERMLENRQEPLPLFGLEILDPWFVGVELQEQAFEYILDRFTSNRFSLVRVRGQVFVSKLTQNIWDEKVKTSRRILVAAVDRAPKELDIRASIESLLIGPGEELRTELWSEATRWANFANQSSDSTAKVLVSYGYGAEGIVEAVLTESDKPLHYSEISQRCNERYGKQVDVRRAHQSALNVGLLFGRGVYGLRKHFPLSDAECSLLIAEAEDLIVGADTQKQWHAREITEAIEERGIDFGGRLNQYVTSIALERSRNLADLGRMVWASRSTGARGTANRIDVHQAIVSYLLTEGRPMHSDEIRERIAQDRGLSGYFQIQPAGDLLHMGPGLWGLASRDSPLSTSESEELIEALTNALELRGKGLHVSELKGALHPIIKHVERIGDPAIILGIAQRSSRCAIAKGQYVFLPGWGDPRRLTAVEAVKRAIRKAGLGGMTLNECAAMAEALAERSIPRTFVSNILAGQIGANFDDVRSRWTPPSDDANDGCDDADFQTN